MRRRTEGPPHHWLSLADLGAQRAAAVSRLPPLTAALAAWDRYDHACRVSRLAPGAEAPMAPGEDRRWLLRWHAGLLGFITALDQLAPESTDARRN